MNNPMNLEDLPEYLRNATNEGAVVNMGMIVQRPNWTKRILFASAICMILVGGIVVFNSTEEIAIVVSSNAGSDIVSTVIKDNGGEVVGINDNTYKVRISRFRNISSFLNKLRSNKMVDSADLETK